MKLTRQELATIRAALRYWRFALLSQPVPNAVFADCLSDCTGEDSAALLAPADVLGLITRLESAPAQKLSPRPRHVGGRIRSIYQTRGR